jgi:hypothetical protein
VSLLLFTTFLYHIGAYEHYRFPPGTYDFYRLHDGDAIGSSDKGISEARGEKVKPAMLPQANGAHLGHVDKELAANIGAQTTPPREHRTPSILTHKRGEL